MGGFFYGNRKPVQRESIMITATVVFDVLFIAGGYVASIYTWPRVKLLINGAQTEAVKLRAKADALIEAAKR
jgi:hypothetical protein